VLCSRHADERRKRRHRELEQDALDRQREELEAEAQQVAAQEQAEEILEAKQRAEGNSEIVQGKFVPYVLSSWYRNSMSPTGCPLHKMHLQSVCVLFSSTSRPSCAAAVPGGGAACCDARSCVL
jgi:hypothetical protein